MESDQIYQGWKNTRREIDIPDGFAERVMEEVHRRAQGHQSNGSLGRLELFMPARWPARIALLCGFFGLGLFRFVFIAANLVLP